jgi:broad specificity phosphatase PhoE
VPAVILVRHAQASFGGERYDVLSELGHRQVAAVAADLERRGMRVTRILSGDLRRQLDTAEPWAAFAGRELEVDPRFNEYDSEDVLTAHSDSDAREEGVAGVSSREFQTILERALHAWIQAGENGPARVPHPAFTGRVEAAMRDVADGLGSGETALVATSGGVRRRSWRSTA